jgi:hypothetical protein
MVNASNTAYAYHNFVASRGFTHKNQCHNARVFYIGVNWEKLSTNKDRMIRHEGLFEILDKTGEFVFYGLKE